MPPRFTCLPIPQPHTYPKTPPPPPLTNENAHAESEAVELLCGHGQLGGHPVAAEDPDMHVEGFGELGHLFNGKER